MKAFEILCGENMWYIHYMHGAFIVVLKSALDACVAKLMEDTI